MICWFEQGITDSVWPLGVVQGLGFLQGSCCPHFDTEAERQDAYWAESNLAKLCPALHLKMMLQPIILMVTSCIVTIKPTKGFNVTQEGLQNYLPPIYYKKISHE